jgi:hypothetical protein
LTEPLRCDKIFLDLLDIIAAFSSHYPQPPINSKGVSQWNLKLFG